MIKLEKEKIVGLEEAIRGMRNPMNSWERSDSEEVMTETPEQLSLITEYRIGQNDHDLMMKLAEAGSVHAKYRRMIVVYVDIAAPLYWWKEFDTYKVGTVANSTSTMHTLHKRDLTIDDFSTDQLFYDEICHLEDLISVINGDRQMYVDSNEEYLKKKYWYNMIQLLPSSFNQMRTVQMNYEVLANIYPTRRLHKLYEWQDFCDWITLLPYSRLITLEE